MGVVAIVRANKFSFVFLLLLIVLPFIASSFIMLLATGHESDIALFSTGAWVIAYCIAAFTMALALTHTTFIALLGGYFLGWVSVVYMIPAYVIASFIGYGLARFIDQGKFISSISAIPGVGGIIANLKKKESSIIFFSRISPVLPFAMMNALLSILKANPAKYLVAGTLGMLPRTLLFIWVGMQGRNIRELIEHPSDNLFSKISFAVLLIFSAAGLFYILKKILSASETEKL